jgi:acetylornithine deacetylase
VLYINVCLPFFPPPPTKKKKRFGIMSKEKRAKNDFLNVSMDEKRFLELMTRVIPLSKEVQNDPASGLVPKEGLVVAELEKTLSPYLKKNGGVLQIETHSFAEGRANVIITCPGRYHDDKTKRKSVTLAGSHLDVVPVDLELWEVEPFKLTRKGDLLYGRGTTDCLGHVCLVTDFLCSLAQKCMDNGKKPVTDSDVVAVFIASEENGSGGNKGVGIDGLDKRGLLDHLKDGTLLWVDCADSKPCMATAGALQWTLRVEGRKAHSGLPNVGINPIELGLQAVKYMQDRFYKDFKAKPEAKEYNFPIASSMKPTQIKCAPGAINQIPPWIEIRGDIRLTPFYDCFKCMDTVDTYIKDLNEGAMETCLPCHGPYSKYEIDVPTDTPGKTERVRGKLSLKFLDRKEPMRGMYCDLKSPGFKALKDSIFEIKGTVECESLTGSLPLVQDMKEAGFDLQMVGFGMSSKYHRPNEACKLSEMVDATKVLSGFVSKVDRDLFKN